MTEIGHPSPGRALTLDGAGGFTLAWSALSDVGNRRSTNEDSYIVEPPVFAVADGMGGHLAGDRASAAVVHRLSERMGEGVVRQVTTEDVERALFEATYDISVVAGGSDIGVGTTVTGAFVTRLDDKPYFCVFNVGDSRVYRFENGELEQVTTDHSLVQELVDSGLITQAQAYQHPEGNIITRAIGFEARPVPDYVLVPIRRGVRLLICSDGLTGEMRDDRIRLHLAAAMTPEQTTKSLVQAALDAGGRDNVTVVIVEVVDGPSFEGDADDTAPDGRYGTR